MHYLKKFKPKSFEGKICFQLTYIRSFGFITKNYNLIQSGKSNNYLLFSLLCVLFCTFDKEKDRKSQLIFLGCCIYSGMFFCHACLSKFEPLTINYSIHAAVGLFSSVAGGNLRLQEDLFSLF